MKSFLFNPVNGVCRPSSYKEIQGFTGMSISAISKAKKNRTKIKSLNGLYIVDDNFTREELDELRYAFFDPHEVWVSIENYPNYLVSNMGRIKSLCKNKEVLISPYLKKSGTLFVGLCSDKGIKEICVHKIVANAFIDKVKGKNCVYHKDGNLENNECNNLCWISLKDIGKLTGRLAHQIPVCKYDKDTNEIIDSYESMAEAGRRNYLSKETIRLAISGNLKTAGGFVWKIDQEFNKKREKSLKLRKKGENKNEKTSYVK